MQRHSADRRSAGWLSGVSRGTPVGRGCPCEVFPLGHYRQGPSSRPQTGCPGATFVQRCPCARTTRGLVKNTSPGLGARPRLLPGASPSRWLPLYPCPRPSSRWSWQHNTGHPDPQPLAPGTPCCFIPNIPPWKPILPGFALPSKPRWLPGPTPLRNCRRETRPRPSPRCVQAHRDLRGRVPPWSSALCRQTLPLSSPHRSVSSAPQCTVLSSALQEQVRASAFSPCS